MAECEHDFVTRQAWNGHTRLAKVCRHCGLSEGMYRHLEGLHPHRLDDPCDDIHLRKQPLWLRA